MNTAELDEVCEACGAACESTDGGMCGPCACRYNDWSDAHAHAHEEHQDAVDEVERLAVELAIAKARLHRAKLSIKRLGPEWKP
jgi:hypothetical protein